MANTLSKAEQFNLAHQLKENVSQTDIGEIVARAAGRDSAYSPATISAWMKHDSWDEYSQFLREQNAHYRTNDSSSSSVQSSVLDNLRDVEDTLAEAYNTLLSIRRGMED